MKRLAVLSVLAASFLLAPTALATFPGQNGKIAYTIGGEIWLTNPDGSNQHLLTGFCSENPAWSPDGRKIAFNTCGSQSRIYVIDADGNHLKALTSGACPDMQPAWSPHGSRIVFRRFRNVASCDNQLWTMKANGTSQRPLTNDGFNANDQNPSLSPDGRKIAFARFNGYLQIWVLDLATGVETDIDQTGATFEDRNPDWSPDGAEITFTRDGPSLPGTFVAVMNADGSNQTVTSVKADESRWSPDGTRLALVTSTLYTMNPDGTDLTSLGTASGSRGLTNSLSWQPCLRKCA